MGRHGVDDGQVARPLVIGHGHDLQLHALAVNADVEQLSAIELYGYTGRCHRIPDPRSAHTMLASTTRNPDLHPDSVPHIRAENTFCCQPGTDSASLWQTLIDGGRHRQMLCTLATTEPRGMHGDDGNPVEQLG